MKKVVFSWLTLISISAVIICGVISSAILYNQAENETKNDLTYFINSILENYDIAVEPDSIAEELSKLTDGLRITIVDSSGIVVGESLADELHLVEAYESGPEILGANDISITFNKRRSETDRKQIIYASKKDGSGNIISLSMVATGLEELFKKTSPAVIMSIVAAMLSSWIIANIITNKFTSLLQSIQKTLADMSTCKVLYDIPLSNYAELDHIIDSINQLSKNINIYLEDLNSQRNIFEFILDNIDQGVILLDSQKRVMIANKAAINLLSFHLDAANKPFTDIIKNQEALKLLDNVYHKDFPASLDFDHHNMVLSLTMIPAMFKDSGEKGAIINILNVTSLRKTDQMKAEFIANASHELKTPVTSIKGFSDLLCSSMITDPDKIADYNKRINIESERMIHIIEDTLLLADLESYREPKKEVVNLRDVATNVIESLDIKIREKEIFASVSKEDVFLEINFHDIESILTNLIENSVKYNVQGGEIEVDMIEQGNKVILTVKDTGIGISPELQARVFERFYRVDKGRSRKIGGTGLGLAIVKHAVSRNGGSITLESQEGIGTTIKMDFYKF